MINGRRGTEPNSPATQKSVSHRSPHNGVLGKERKEGGRGFDEMCFPSVENDGKAMAFPYMAPR